MLIQVITAISLFLAPLQKPSPTEVFIGEHVDDGPSRIIAFDHVFTFAMPPWVDIARNRSEQLHIESSYDNDFFVNLSPRWRFPWQNGVEYSFRIRQSERDAATWLRAEFEGRFLGNCPNPAREQLDAKGSALDGLTLYLCPSTRDNPKLGRINLAATLSKNSVGAIISAQWDVRSFDLADPDSYSSHLEEIALAALRFRTGSRIVSWRGWPNKAPHLNR